MKQLLYGQCVILVADAVADAILAYSAACARIGLVERVDVPTFDAFGSHATRSIVIGSQAGVAVADAADDELGDDFSGVFGSPTRAFLAEIRRRIRRVATLERARGIQASQAETVSKRSTWSGVTSGDDPTS